MKWDHLGLGGTAGDRFVSGVREVLVVAAIAFSSSLMV